MKIKTKNVKRHGQGIGSGKGGHTTGRGQKGQKSRGKVGILFEGVKVKKSFIKRLPFLRGKAKFAAKPKAVEISLTKLNAFKDGETVNLESLIKANMVDSTYAKKYGVKVLAGKLEKKLIVDLPMTKGAAKEVEKVGKSSASK